MLADSRLPAGGHAHSGGLEAAVTAGVVTGLADLAVFLRARLHTAGLVAAAIAAAACRLKSTPGGVQPTPESGRGTTAAAEWSTLDAEVDARMPSPAGREASRHQGRALLRAARVAWPSPVLDLLAATSPNDRPGPHHPVVLGASGAAAGCDSAGVARVAAYLAVSGPAGAAVRLRGLDPLAVHGLLARLAPEIEDVAGRAARAAGQPFRELPSPASPRLDLLAEAHIRTEARLFVS